MAYLTDAWWQDLKQQYTHITEQLSSSALENNERIKLQKKASFLATLLERYQILQTLQNQHQEFLDQKKSTTDPELISLFQEELELLDSHIAAENAAVEELLFPPDPLNNRSVFVEIRAGTGGQEAALFAGDLMRMYTLYGLKKGWKVSVVSESHTDLGGYREVILHIEGKKVYGHLKHESGVHRVQRVPKTETSGRVHTSTATVAILPEAEEVEFVNISPSDLRIDVFRAGGAGGQHVNKTESAVRITHLPTNIVVQCQDERSQHKNKEKALKVLQSRLIAVQQEKQEAEMSQKRKSLIGTGMRSEKVRTYNFPQNRVTDHQVELTLNKLDMVIEGHVDEIITALMNKEREERRQKPLIEH